MVSGLMVLRHTLLIITAWARLVCRRIRWLARIALLVPAVPMGRWLRRRWSAITVLGGLRCAAVLGSTAVLGLRCAAVLGTTAVLGAAAMLGATTVLRRAAAMLALTVSAR